ncbi:MAG: hypothetical protein KDB69_05490, partial [Acidimicrobiia bacterium]|nr:hypothetical protein [Acidimicrobiia bacterium]
MRRAIIIAAVAAPLAIVLFVVAVYAYEEIVTDDHISHGVTAEGVDLSRMTPAEASIALTSYEASLATQPVEVVVDGHSEQVLPANIGF